jgi:hypothetical protein
MVLWRLPLICSTIWREEEEVETEEGGGGG